jgi:hypothetical protein
MTRILLGVISVAIAAGVAATIAGAAAWNRATAAAIDRLAASQPATAVDPGAMSRLPPPVSRYFRKVLKQGQPMIRSAVATQDAEFFINGEWRPLRATQHFRISPPAFVWDARIAMAPLIPVAVRDSYIDGRGSMQAALLGVYSLADQTDKRELNLGALQRLLGEAVWLPTMLLPSHSVAWSPRDDRSAFVSLTDGGNTVTLLFQFDPDDAVAAISGERYREGGGDYTLQDWQIRCDEYRERSGILVPIHCEVAWMNAGVPEPYWRGRITSIEYRYD